MRIPFAWKLGLAIILLSVGLTSIGVYIFYTATYSLTISQMGKNLRDIGSLGSMLFDKEDREAIKRLKLLAEQESIVSQKDIDAMKPGFTLKSLSPETIKRLHNSEDFQLILDKLQMIAYSTYNEVAPLKDNYHAIQLTDLAKGMVGVYLGVDVKESPDRTVLKYLVSSFPEPTATGWPGNPIGNLSKGFAPADYWAHGQTFINDQLVEDEFYQCLYAGVPIFDNQDHVMAYLGLDYAPGRELEKLKQLRMICYSLIAASFLLSAALSYFTAKWLYRPLRILHDAAGKVRDHDYDIIVDIKNRDEFGTLGKVFNQMVSNIRKATKALEEKNKQLVSVISDMHDGVGSILTAIALISQEDARKDDSTNNRLSVNRLASMGLIDIRFLMGILDDVQDEVLDCHHYDWDKLVDEIRFLAVDIFAPYRIQVTFKITGKNSGQQINFRDYFDIQRIFRESFANIIKHSKADQCQILISFTPAAYIFAIHDNGEGFQGEWKKNGRGIASIAQRVARLGGTIEHNFSDGSSLRIILPQTIDALPS